MTESEGTTQSGASSSSGGSSSSGSPGTTRTRTRTRKKTTGTRRKTTTRRKSPASGRKTTSRRASSARRTTRRAGLEGLLNDLAKRAERAGTTISELSEGGANAARRGLGVVTATSRKTISRVRKEWDGMDNTRRVQFVGALLAALAATAAGVRKATKK